MKPFKGCCDTMKTALKYAIIRTEPIRFGPDVLDLPLGVVKFCPWCGAQLTEQLSVDTKYGEIRKTIKELPDTWCPALLHVMIRACVRKQVFAPGGLLNVVRAAQEEEENNRADALAERL